MAIGDITPKRPQALGDAALYELERLAEAMRFAPVPNDVLAELVRVYRLAKQHDASDDVSPYDFFFE